jgi:hypothetical protein
MQFYQVPAARTGEQPVHVLGDEGEVGGLAFECRRRMVARVWFCTHSEILPPPVPVPYEVQISSERLRGRELLGVVARPERGSRLAQGRHSTLGPDAGAGQCDDASCFTEGLDQSRRKILHLCEAQPATARSNAFAPSATGTSRSSPEAISLTVQTPRSSSSSPRTAAYAARERSACLNCPFALRPA